MLTTDQLRAVFGDVDITPAVDYNQPVPGEFVRTSTYAEGTLSRTDHRDLYIESGGTDTAGREYLRTVCINPQGVIRGISYADANGRYPQFQPAAPSGPYSDPTEQYRWRAGYSDALEFVERSERFIVTPATYLAGRDAGIQKRKELDLKPYVRPREAVVCTDYGQKPPKTHRRSSHLKLVA